MHGIDYFLRNWLHEEPRIQYFNITLSLTPQLVVGNDPTRFAVILPHDSGRMYSYWFQDQQPVYAQPQWNINTSDGTALLNFDMLGGLVCYPIWAACAAQNPTPTIITVSYQPQRHQLYRRMVNEWLSKYTAP